MDLIAQNGGSQHQQSGAPLELLAQIQRFLKRRTPLVGILGEQHLQRHPSVKALPNAHSQHKKKHKTKTLCYFVVRIDTRLDLAFQNQLHQLVLQRRYVRVKRFGHSPHVGRHVRTAITQTRNISVNKQQ